MISTQFVKELSDLSFENTFNPYSDRYAIHDLDDAPHCRSQTLLSMLEAATDCEIDSLWIGRDLGHRGGRRTGLAFTDDVHFQAHTQRWGLSIHRSTKGKAVAEQTARRLCDQYRVIQVRHPSHGGQTRFLTQMDELYPRI